MAEGSGCRRSERSAANLSVDSALCRRTTGQRGTHTQPPGLKTRGGTREQVERLLSGHPPLSPHVAEVWPSLGPGAAARQEGGHTAVLRRRSLTAQSAARSVTRGTRDGESSGEGSEWCHRGRPAADARQRGTSRGGWYRGSGVDCTAVRAASHARGLQLLTAVPGPAPWPPAGRDTCAPASAGATSSSGAPQAGGGDTGADVPERAAAEAAAWSLSTAHAGAGRPAAGPCLGCVRSVRVCVSDRVCVRRVAPPLRARVRPKHV